MSVFYFLQKYLDGLNDTKFMYRWEKMVLTKMVRFLMGVFFVYLFIVLLLGYGANEVMPPIFAMFVALVFGFFFGYTVIVNTIRFMAVNNSRYLQLKMNIPDVRNGINYDNVVG